jgi:DHA1 family bicyclomycin/chloramphenicol resistance-like MFS transporter
MPQSKRHLSLIILILGALTALGPFSIDMYLPSFPEIATDFSTTVARVSFSLSSYFVGLALGQIMYGPLLDRYGRKKPLYLGLGVYILTSLGCLLAASIEGLVFLRFIQASGGCVAGVAAMAIVRDLFEPQEGAKVFSRLILILGVSPLLAPTIGGYLATHFGWHSVFLVLAALALLLLLTVFFFLPESHQADPSVSLRPGPIYSTFREVIKEPQFYTYVFSGAVAFSGLFAYLAGSPIIFMDVFQVSPQAYSWIFALIALGLISASQLNVILLKYFSNAQILHAGLLAQACIGLVLVSTTAMGWFNLYSIVFFLFLLLSCIGFTNPNAASLSLAPFAKTAGSASALMGFVQMGVGALVSMMIGLFALREILSIVLILAITSSMAYLILRMGLTKIVYLHTHEEKR